ncbi:MAG: hypothetical protein KBB52_04925 [Candidatus Omnitrophica bacterium]|nr:hypothetical protein [Candidatus Omnitrophota bacterium]HPM42496.1 hypothetical protein [Candidatus Omnitrophota bacterium]
MARLLIALGLATILSGCSGMVIRDGGLAINKDTTASIEDLGAVRLTSRY